MPELTHWGAFLAATFVVLLIPGPSVMYVMARALESGYRGALFSALGLALGDALQVVCAIAGLSAIVGSSPLVLTSLQYAGAGYLIFLGSYRLLRASPASWANAIEEERRSAPATSRSLVAQGFLALNPKTALFFAALFSQFVTDGGTPAWLQMLPLGCAFVILGFFTNAAYGCVGGALHAVARRNVRFQLVAHYVGAIALIGLGVAAALATMPAGGASPVANAG